MLCNLWLIFGQFSFLWTSVGITGDIIILISSGVAGIGLGGGDGGGATSCDDGSGGTTWDGGGNGFSEGDDIRDGVVDLQHLCDTGTVEPRKPKIP